MDHIEQLIEQYVTIGTGLIRYKPPPVLYHYCSTRALNNIISSETLWNSHIHDMNDNKEFSHGMEMFRDGLNLLRKKGVDRKWIESVRTFIEGELPDPDMAPFVFCSTPNKNQKSQWNQYSDSSKGVCLGFRATFFVEPRKVLYRSLEKKKIVKRTVEIFCQLINKIHNSGGNINEGWIVRGMALAYFRIAYMQSVRFKEMSWQQEREWRGVILKRKTTPEIKQMNGRRYIEVPFDLKKDLLEIVVGPKASTKTKTELDSLKIAKNLDFEVVTT